ncbi:MULTISPECIES: NAD-dependent epimerase/dehydratase family protein [unclassified Streptomyces]|uniref:NAD-dependent epimerase/dehydratase family protein n=1 Tax=unclassified Streptomyces TaxID=2593676 RepID=UPI000AD232A7|nr:MULTISPECIES: NAD-dependent epimerase/dehydratase family protein [unclassified Streptomyces]AZM61203.1 epimerase [Streptomyces sp. WAC 01438]RSM90995.1 epimerase [Streptomyces sp. WAC 01420]
MTAGLLLTGATGFIGSRVAAAAREHPGVRVRTLSRRAPRGEPPTPTEPGSTTVPGTTTVPGDLADPRTLRGSCDGVDVLVHCASRVSGDPEAVAAVNDLGTKALVEEAVRSGVRRIVYVSTAAVHGRGPFRGVRPGEAPIAPASATSRSRAAAERHVLAAGGLVLRPHLVHGEGDRWVIPGLVSLLRELSAPLTGCGALHSMIDVGTLGRAVLAAALSPHHGPGTHYVAHPDPVPAAELLTAVYEQVERPGDGTPLDLPTARARAAASPWALHHLDMLTADHWFTDDAFWKDLDCTPGEGFAAAFARSARWYRQHVATNKTG